jgi:acyl carrier protein
MRQDAVMQELSVIFRAVFDRRDLIVTTAMTARDIPGWDSFKQVEIIMACEDRFGFEFEPHEIDELGNVGDLLDVVTRHAA